jgi:CubicO group peptidase (beta-lactamase class C family)
MKKCIKFSGRWLLLGVLIIVAYLSGINPAKAAYHVLSSQYAPALKLLKETQNETGKKSNQCRNYLRKKRKYSRFLDAYIKDKRKELAAEGVSISVISKDDLLFLKGYGDADKETQTPVTPETLFSIASVSKVFTGVAVMQLVEQGAIDLDAPLENYIPGFSYKTHFPDAGPITVRTLMTHQSGLVDVIKGSESITKPEHHFRELVGLFKTEYLANPPGYITGYSNSAVALLGIVVEAVSGMAFKDYIEENICKPLGMLTSNFSLRDYMMPMMAKSYNNAGAESPFIYTRDEPADAFITNAMEMSLFMRMILNGGELSDRQILKPETLQQMFVQQNGDIELDFPNDHGKKQGLIWELYRPTLDYAGKYVGHGGDTLHYHAQLHLLPEHDLAVIVETNSETGAGLSRDVADTAMIKALEIFKGLKRPDAPPLPAMVPLTRDHIRQTAGTYATNYLGLLSIYPDPNNHRLFAAFGDLELELKPHQDNWFSLYLKDQPAPGFENWRITVKRITDKNGARKRIVGLQMPKPSGVFPEPFGCEYKIPKELSPEWKKRVGAYRIINPDSYSSSMIPLGTNVSIQEQPPGVLHRSFLHGNRPLSSVIDPIFNDQAVKTGLGRNVNETIQVVDCGGEECLYHLGYLYKKQPK